MNITLEEISPDLASGLLASNEKNRSLNAHHVQFLAAQMLAGAWQMAGDPIRVASSGRLLDGQHRLSAIVQTGITLSMVVIRNLPEETFQVMDTGRIRSAADVLSAEGVLNATTQASTARMAINYQKGNFYAAIGQSHGRKTKVGVSNTEIVQFLTKNNLDEFVKAGIQWYRESRIFTASEYAFLYYTFNPFDTPTALFFLSSLASGAGLEAGTPIFLLRKKLEQYKFNKVSCPPSERLALTIKAWNLFRTDKTVSLLTWNPLKETFPLPL